ncbi:MAG: MFS transporter [Gammaproteobacteria bacterium]|nr:MFS transporter [Gammaproteobacteria bacterium]
MAASARDRPKFYYGWVIVGAMSFVGAVTMGMGTLNFGLFINPMGAELGISRATFGWAQSFRQLAGAATSLPVGYMIDRFGARWLLAAAAAITGMAMIAIAYIDSGWQLVVLFSVIGLTGFAAPGALLTSVPVLKWFVRNRGRAVAIMSLGIPIGAMIFLPLTQYLINLLGWRTTWIVLGGVGIVAIVPVSMLFVRRQPEDMGLAVDGGATVSGHDTMHITEQHWTLKEALRTTAFWRLTVVFSLMSLAIGTVGLHRIAAFVDRGLDPTLVAASVAVDAAFAGAATFIMGMITHRVPSRYLGALGFLLLALATVLTIYGYTIVMMFVSMAVFGLGIGGMLLLQNIVWAEYYGRAYLGGIRGAVMPITMIIGGVGAPLAGYVKDVSGSYDSIWGVSVVLMIIGAGVVATTRPPIKQEP